MHICICVYVCLFLHLNLYKVYTAMYTLLQDNHSQSLIFIISNLNLKKKQQQQEQVSRARLFSTNILCLLLVVHNDLINNGF